MYGSSYIFTKPFFTGWIILGIVWMFFSFGIVGIYPIVENYKTIIALFQSMYMDLIRFRRPRTEVSPQNNLEMQNVEKPKDMNNI